MLSSISGRPDSSTVNSTVYAAAITEDHMAIVILQDMNIRVGVNPPSSRLGLCHFCSRRAQDSQLGNAISHVSGHS